MKKDFSGKEVEESEHKITTLNFALKYADLGLPVYPTYPVEDGGCTCKAGANCPHPGKHPRISGGYKSATLDAEKIRQFCQSVPTPNISIATGGSQNILVLDFDKRSGGLETLAMLETKYGPLPKTVMVNTGGKGKHFLFKSKKPFKSSSGILPGLDIKAENGGIVAPPSRHISGGQYEWGEDSAPWETEIADLPSWVGELLEAPDITDKIHPDSSDTIKIQEGGRNEFLFKKACVLARAGLSENAIMVALKAENEGRCEIPLHSDEVSGIVQSALSYSDGWSQPLKLPCVEFPAPLMSESLVPKALFEWAKDISERMQVPLEMIVVPAIIAFSGVIGRKIRIRPKEKDDWEVIPNLWGGVVAPPSSLKSPSLKEVLAPIEAIQKKFLKDFTALLNIYEMENEAHQSLIKTLTAEHAKAVKGGDDESAINLSAKILGLKSELEARKPRQKRLLVHDATTEKLAEILKDNQNGMIIFRDELIGFLQSLDKKGREGDRAFYLESWGGDGSFSQDRVIRGTVILESFALTIMGGIQPDRLRGYFDSVLEKGSDDDGFLQRFQLMVWVEISKEYTFIDRSPNMIAKNKVKDLFYQIEELKEKSDKPIVLQFNLQSQKIFNDWLSKLELRLRSGTLKSSAFQSHLGKFRSLVPSLALIFQVIEFGKLINSTVQISNRNLELAIAWSEYLEGHATKIYSSAINPEAKAAHRLAKKIFSGEIYCGMSVRSIRRHCWSGLGSGELVDKGLELLERLGWVKRQRLKFDGKSGATSEVIRLNPNLELLRVNGSLFEENPNE